MIKRRGSVLGRKRGPIVQDDTPATPFTISTPYRLLRTPLAEVSDTPFAIKYPLLAFINSEWGCADLEIKMKAQKIVSHAAQQSIIAKVGAVRELCLFTNKRHSTLVSELKRQYILALLEGSEDASAVLATLRHLAKSPSISDNENNANAITDQVNIQDTIQGHVCAMEDTDQGTSAKVLQSSTIHQSDASLVSCEVSSPTKSTPSRTTPIGQTPLNVMKRHHVNRLRIQAMTQKIAEEPEHIKVAVRKRLSSIIEEPDEERSLNNAMSNVVYSAKRAQSIAQTPSKKMRYSDAQGATISPSVGTLVQIPSNSTRGPPASVMVTIGETPEMECSTDFDIRSGDVDSCASNHPPNQIHKESTNPSRQKENYAGVHSLLQRSNKSSVPASITEEDDEEGEHDSSSSIHSPSAEQDSGGADQCARASTRPTTADSSKKSPGRRSMCESKPLDAVKINRRSSVASMFTSRGAPQKGNKFQSRISLTAKMRRTREKRQMRNKQRDEGDGASDENEPLKQAGPRLRKIERYEAIAESKFSAFHDEAGLLPFRNKLACDGRKLLTDKLTRTTNENKWQYLLSYFYGHNEFRPNQRESLEYLDLYDSGALLLSLPTGAGKSMVFALAGVMYAIQFNGVSVMVLPTKALVADQYESATRSLGEIFNIVKLHSGMEISEYATVFKGLAEGLVDFLLTTPEQYTSMTIINLLKHAPRRLSLICVDEAHCLSEWSHTFRPAYQSVLAISDFYHPDSRQLLMTATITTETENAIRQMLQKDGANPIPIKVIRMEEGHWRQDLHMRIKHFSDTNLNALESALLMEQKKWDNSTQLIFVWMKYQAEQLVRQLKEHGFGEAVYFYHSEVNESEKKQLAEALIAGKIDILVSTQALGVGLDVSHITNVYHLSPPGSVEQWLQEVGRCNRDGRASLATCYGFGVFKEFWNRRQKTAGGVIDTVALSAFFKRIMTPEQDESQVVTTTKEMRYRLSSKAHKMSIVRWRGDNHSVLTMDLNAVKKDLNCWTDDEIYVISAIVERSVLEDQFIGNNQLGWWILSDLELRCFDRDLDELGTDGGIVTELRQRCWRDRPNQGVFKLRWSELLMDPELGDPLDLRDKIYSVCHENKISVRAAPASRRLYILKRQDDLTLLGDKLVSRIRDQMLRNNAAQLKKQEVVRVAWKIAEECDQEQLRAFLKLYFDNTLSWPLKEERYRGWLYEGVQFLNDTGARAVFRNDVQLLRDCLATSGASTTPIACARILCGLQRAESLTQAWRGRYANVPFEIVHELAR